VAFCQFQHRQAAIDKGQFLADCTHSPMTVSEHPKYHISYGGEKESPASGKAESERSMW
jgi:hypothetical protein